MSANKNLSAKVVQAHPEGRSVILIVKRELIGGNYDHGWELFDPETGLELEHLYGFGNSHQAQGWATTDGYYAALEFCKSGFIEKIRSKTAQENS